MNLKAIKNIAYELMGSKSSHQFKEKGNKYYHGERVASLVLTLRKIVLPDDETRDNILTVSAWFHDISNGAENHCTEGAKKTREVLNGCCTPAELDEICEIIAVHDDRKTGGNLISDYIKLHQDADHLDHFGTFDVWTHFIYAVSHGQTILEARDFLVNVRPTENERYRNELNFEISKTIFDEKTEFLERFTERFGVECTGGVWDLDRILTGLREKAGDFCGTNKD